MITLVGHGDSSSVGLFISVCARSVCVCTIFIVYAPFHAFFLFSLYPYAMFRRQKREWSIAVMEDGSWEGGHGPVMLL